MSDTSRKRVEIWQANDLRRDIFLNPILLNEVEVKVQAMQSIHENPMMSMISLPVNQIKSTPVLFGEKDLFKVLQLMPGVQGGNEGSSGLYVRGGGNDQNLVILDDATAYNVNHLFGVFSLFNGDAIKSVQLFKGGFPAKYGGRVSSVLDITMREGDNEKYSGEIGLGIISSRFTIDGPISKEKGGFLLSGRRTYHDIWTNQVMLEREKTSYYFYDSNAKANWIIDRQNRIYLSAYFGKDKMANNDHDQYKLNNSGLSWQNFLISFRWNHLFRSGAFANASLIFSDYSTNITMIEGNRLDNRKYNADYKSGICDLGLKYDLQFQLGLHQTIRTGFVSTLHYFQPAAVTINNDYTQSSQQVSFSIYGLESGIYIEDEVRFKRWMFLNGIRISHYYSGKEIFIRPEPRLSATYSLNKSSGFKMSFALMNQYMHLSSNTGTGIPTMFWLPVTKQLLPQSSVQYALGFVSFSGKTNTEISLETFYKKTNNNLTFSDNSSYLLFNNNSIDPFQDWEKNMIQGEAEATGLEFLIHRKTGVINGWIAYTISFSRNRFNEINDGKWYITDHNRLHDFSIVFSYAVTERSTLGVNWVYSSGRMITLPEHSAQVFIPVPNNTNRDELNYWIFPADFYTNRNNWKTKDYHRLDISLQFFKA
jgi:hypothetical protein